MKTTSRQVLVIMRTHTHTHARCLTQAWWKSVLSQDGVVLLSGCVYIVVQVQGVKLVSLPIVNALR